MLRPTVRCTECNASFEVNPNLQPGDRLDCPKCGEPLKVVHNSPLKVEWAFEDHLEGPNYSVRSYFRRGFRR